MITPLFIQENKNREFQKTLDSTATQIKGWKAKLLSHEKKTLIRSILQSILVYARSTFKLPDSICDKANFLINKFW